MCECACLYFHLGVHTFCVEKKEKSGLNQNQNDVLLKTLSKAKRVCKHNTRANASNHTLEQTLGSFVPLYDLLSLTLFLLLLLLLVPNEKNPFRVVACVKRKTSTCGLQVCVFVIMCAFMRLNSLTEYGIDYNESEVVSTAMALTHRCAHIPCLHIHIYISKTKRETMRH